MSIKQVYKTSDDKEFTNLIDAEKHEASINKDKGFEKYLNGYSGRRLLSKNNLEDYGIWKISGEDPNCDVSGHHHNPHLETVEGVLKDVVKHALKLKGFYTWGGGGEIEKVKLLKFN